MGESPVSVSAALPAPLGVVRETGTVALTAGPQFDVRGPNLRGGTRIDAHEFDLPNFSQRPEMQAVCGGTIEAAFRYVTASGRLRVERRAAEFADRRRGPVRRAGRPSQAHALEPVPRATGRQRA